MKRIAWTPLENPSEKGSIYYVLRKSCNFK